MRPDGMLTAMAIILRREEGVDEDADSDSGPAANDSREACSGGDVGDPAVFDRVWKFLDIATAGKLASTCRRAGRRHSRHGDLASALLRSREQRCLRDRWRFEILQTRRIMRYLWKEDCLRMRELSYDFLHGLAQPPTVWGAFRGTEWACDCFCFRHNARYQLFCRMQVEDFDWTDPEVERMAAFAM